ncbi:MAG: 50S ribosomal protein L23 [Deltaproteobacteria bacterium]|nr:50S ribosomal protein L23 [Deltaproteobacteria bacterium]
MTDYDIIIRPLITEKSNIHREVYNKISFVVRKDANKIQIKQAVENIFKVKVAKVNTVIVRGKMRRYGRYIGKRASYKKAIVTLKPGYSIDILSTI